MFIFCYILGQFFKWRLHVDSMEFKKILKEFQLKPVLNKRNGQMNFSIKKTSLPKEVKDKLSRLKSIKLKIDDFEYY